MNISLSYVPGLYVINRYIKAYYETIVMIPVWLHVSNELFYPNEVESGLVGLYYPWLIQANN